MALATRAELEALERRLLRAEQTILKQDGQIQLLQARLDSGTHIEPFPMAMRDRSRTPRGAPLMAAPKPLFQTQSNGPVMSVAEFAMANGLDDKCSEALQNQPPEVQHHVISQGPVEGRNPSAMVMSRITKCGSEIMVAGPPSMGGIPIGSVAADTFQGVEDFIVANGVDDKCAESLHAQSVECQMAVMAQGPAEGRNPSAMVMGRIAKFLRGEL